MSSSTQSLHQYEGLMGDSLPCPSCSGSGRIPKDQEGALIALIPANDSRLKPRRTVLYMCIGMGLCVLISGLLFFFLLPRSVAVSSLATPISKTDFNQYLKKEFINMSFVAPITIDNWNYYTVVVTNATGQVYSRLNPFSRKMIGEGFNDSGIHIPLRSSGREIFINYTVTLTYDTGVQYCDFWLTPKLAYLSMDFEVTLTLEYMGRQEFTGIEKTTRQVCCGNQGNCTKSVGFPSTLSPIILR